LGDLVGKDDVFTCAVARFIEDRALIAPRAGVVVGVSGGADSVALLEVLCRLADERGHNWRLTVAHLNHGLRQDAEADAKFVAELAATRGLPCVIERCNVAEQAARTHCGIEEAGRRVRHAFLDCLAGDCGASCVALGHHADDNVETVLYRIVRGTHLRGLAGMPASRRLGASGVALVRPLLECRRQEIEAFCRRAGLTWRTDPTNVDVRYRRNFIRHQLLPLLRENLNPKVQDAIGRLAAAAQDVESHLVRQARDFLKGARRPAGPDAVAVDRDLLASQPTVVRAYVMRLALELLAAPSGGLTADRYRQLAWLTEPEGPAAVSLGGGFVARRQGGLVVVEAAGRQDEHQGDELVLDCPGTSSLASGWKITCQVEPFDSAGFESHCRRHPPGVELLDADKVHGPVTCRTRQDGDAFHPLGSPGRQSVSNFLTNLKLPACARGSVRCICDGLGIVYLAPLRIDERVKVAPGTKRTLRICASDLDPLTE
jgi:tRNA(Ile)-lysidine synthase